MHAPRSGSSEPAGMAWESGRGTGLRAPWCLLLRERCGAGRLPRAQDDPFPGGAEALESPTRSQQRGSRVTTQFGAEGLIV